MSNHGFTVEDADRLIEPVIHLPDVKRAFRRVQAITDFRKDDAEARVLYLCRPVQAEGQAVNGEDDTQLRDELYILKCKVQAPSVLAGGLTTPVPGPSAHTADELKALQVFTETNAPSLPHLIGWKTTTQGSDGPMPGGYIVYIVMTLMPGQHLMDLKFWSMAKDQQEEIRRAFIPAIKHVWRLGFEPYDCALRNILWESETQIISLVDFEHWHPATRDPINMNEREEMQRWGIVKRPPPSTHWQEWFYSEGLTKRK